ncbi:MAG: CHAD domain-containing protein [Cyclobacteriaceae bacterium]|nr:CHAD domain-containing protein [Cyclobacteriaceae bacterium]
MKTAPYYAKARVRAILNALEKYHQFQETDSLHRLRVEIKKFKSVIMVLGHSDKKFDAHEHYLSLRNVFRKAGQIRQPAVLIELMLMYGVSGLPVERLGDPKKAADKFRSDTPFFMTQVKKLGRKLRPRIKKIRKKDINGYIKELEKYIRETLVPRLNASQLHSARKRMKQIVYLTGLTDRVSKEDRKFYSRMEKDVGVLHDKETLLELLTGLPRKQDVTAAKMLLKKQVAAERKEIAAKAKAFYQKED